MDVDKCYVFRLKRKNLLSPTSDACCPLLALSSIQFMTGEPRPRYIAPQLVGESGAYDQDMQSREIRTCRRDMSTSVVDLIVFSSWLQRRVSTQNSTQKTAFPLRKNREVKIRDIKQIMSTF